MKKQKQKSDTFRQGDVILIATAKTPSPQARRITDKGRTILAYGEQTGHAHEVIATPQLGASDVAVADGVAAELEHAGTEFGDCASVARAFAKEVRQRVENADDVPAMELFEEPDGTRLLVIRRAAELRHQEHGVIALAPNVTFEVRRQVEYTPAAIKTVAD